MDTNSSSRPALVTFAEKERARRILTAFDLDVADIIAARDTIERYHAQQPAHARSMVLRATAEAIADRRAFWTLRERAPYVRWDGRMSCSPYA